MKVFFTILSVLLATASCSYIPAQLGSLDSRAAGVLAKMSPQQQALLAAADSATSAQCFDAYLPQMDASEKQWAANYEACAVTANTSRTSIDEDMAQKQSNLTAAATTIVEFINNCQTIKPSLEFFNCFSNMYTMITPMNTLSYNASYDGVSMNEQLNDVTSEMTKCTIDADRSYADVTTQQYNMLFTCLTTGTNPSATTTTTVATPTVSESTAAPTTVVSSTTVAESTTVSSTAVPSTTTVVVPTAPHTQS